MSPPSRAENRAQMEAAILRTGRELLAEHGAAGLSLREVARSLGVVSSAVYRYVASRDELLTLLLVDAYSALADDVDAALAGIPEADGHGRLHALAHAMRAWALGHPAQWGLVYGSPVPGYAAPEERTTPPGTRVLACLAKLAGRLPVPESATAIGPELAAYLREGLAGIGVDIDLRNAALALALWSCIVGTISAEIFGQLGPGGGTIGADLLDRSLELVTGAHEPGRHPG